MSTVVTNVLESLDNPTNVVTVDQLVQTRVDVFLHLKRLAAEAGFNLVDGSFEKGGTVTSTTDALWCETTGQMLMWAGSYSKVVAAGSTITSAGGIGAGLWADVTNISLRSELLNNLLGIPFNVSGCTQTAQTQNTTMYLGVNGIQSSSNLTSYLTPYTSTIQTVNIIADTTPATGQTYKFTVLSGSTTIGSGTIANGSTSIVITVNTKIAALSQISIKSVFSATSGSSLLRFNMTFKA